VTAVTTPADVVPNHGPTCHQVAPGENLQSPAYRRRRCLHDHWLPDNRWIPLYRHECDPANANPWPGCHLVDHPAQAVGHPFNDARTSRCAPGNRQLGGPPTLAELLEQSLKFPSITSHSSLLAVRPPPRRLRPVGPDGGFLTDAAVTSVVNCRLNPSWWEAVTPASRT
jgi:hypothetical protein